MPYRRYTITCLDLFIEPPHLLHYDTVPVQHRYNSHHNTQYTSMALSTMCVYLSLDLLHKLHLPQGDEQVNPKYYIVSTTIPAIHLGTKNQHKKNSNTIMKLAVAALLATSVSAFQAPTMTFSLGKKKAAPALGKKKAVKAPAVSSVLSRRCTIPFR